MRSDEAVAVRTEIDSAPLLFRLFPELEIRARNSLMTSRAKAFQTVLQLDTDLSQTVLSVKGTMRAMAVSGAIGRKTTLDIIEADEIVALPQILRGERLPYTLEAQGQVELLSFSTDALLDFVESYPQVRETLALYNSCSGVRQLASYWLDHRLLPVTICDILNRHCRKVEAQKDQAFDVANGTAVFVTRGALEVSRDFGDGLRACGRLVAGEWMSPEKADAASLGFRLTPLSNQANHVILFEGAKLARELEKAPLTDFPSNCREMARESGLKSRMKLAFDGKELGFDWLAKHGYSVSVSELKFATNNLDALHCSLTNFAKVIDAPIKLSPVDLETGGHGARVSLGRIAELFERNGFITRAIRMSATDLGNFHYPATAIISGLPVVVLDGNSSGLTVLHPIRRLICIDLPGPAEWDGRLLQVEASEFEEALELARKKNFQNDKKLLAEFGLGGIFKKEKGIFLNLICLAMFGSLFEALLPMFVETVIDRILVKKDLASETTYIGGSILLLAFLGLAKFIEKACHASQMQKIGLKVRRLFIRNMMQMASFRYAESMSTDFFSRLSLIDKIVNIKSMMATSRLTAYIECGIYLAILGLISPGIGVISLIGAVLIVFVHRHNMEHLSHEVHGMSDLKRHMRLRIGEQFSMGPTIKSYSSESNFVNRSELSYFDHQISVAKMSIYERRSKTVSNLLASVVGGLSLAVLTYQAFHDVITPGQFVAVMLLLQCFSRPAQEIGHLAGEAKFLEIEEGAIATYLIQGDYSYQSRLYTESKRLHGLVKFDRVGFRYDNLSGPCLNEVSFTVAPGEVLAIVGRSGSGKTTVGRIIAGLVRPSFGNVYYDGIESRAISNFSLFDQIGYVSQKNIIFSGSILANIAFGDDEPDFERARNAASIAGAVEFIESLPAGWNHVLTLGGQELSAGEVMQVCVARAIYRAPRILILDELGANLDPRLVQLISENLTQMPDPVTLIVITQRLATIKKVDKIIVMKNGYIVEEGRHGQLLKARKEYAELFRSQVSSF